MRSLPFQNKIMERKIKALKRFRMISLAEGISFLLLLFIAMPLKYYADAPAMVKYVGWAHGVLFVAYLAAGLQTALVCRWKLGRVAIGVVASVLPFGPFVFERSVKKEENQIRHQKV